MHQNKGYVIVSFVSLSIALLLFLLEKFLAPAVLFILSICLMSLGLNFLFYLLKRTSSVFLFLLLTSILTFQLDTIGISGWRKILVFSLSAAIFEIVFKLLNRKITHAPLAILISSTIAITFIPILAALFLSLTLALSIPNTLINLILLAFVSALVTSGFTFLLWYDLQANRMVIKFQAYLGTLGRNFGQK
jgi:hypothetical protein